MHLSAKVEYACVAVLELARHFELGEPVRMRKIVETHGIPSPFLVQIMLQLKAAGLVESTRGAAGGYRLLRDPAAITLGEVKAIIEGPAGELVSNMTSPTPGSQILLDTWRQVDAAEREMLDGVTFGDLAERLSVRPHEMYYI